MFIRKHFLNSEVIAGMFHSGMTSEEIAKVSSCSTYPVKLILRLLGLSRRACRRPGRGVGKENSAWKGGRLKTSGGYIVLRLDGDRSNNAISNLEVLSQSEHAAIHARQRRANGLVQLST